MNDIVFEGWHQLLFCLFPVSFAHCANFRLDFTFRFISLFSPMDSFFNIIKRDSICIIQFCPIDESTSPSTLALDAFLWLEMRNLCYVHHSWGRRIFRTHLNEAGCHTYFGGIGCRWNTKLSLYNCALFWPLSPSIVAVFLCTNTSSPTLCPPKRQRSSYAGKV